MNKTDLLFQMLDNPDQYSEAQWQDILADDPRTLYADGKDKECRPSVANN